MNEIVLNNGTHYPAAWCGEAFGLVSMELKGENTFQGIVEVFGNDENTSEIQFVPGEGETPEVYTGFTTLQSITRDRYTQRFRVTLEKVV